MKKFEVDYYDYERNCSSPIDVIVAPNDYTAEQYIEDCNGNADDDWCEMLASGKVELREIVED